MDDLENAYAARRAARATKRRRARLVDAIVDQLLDETVTHLLLFHDDGAQPTDVPLPPDFDDAPALRAAVEAHLTAGVARAIVVRGWQPEEQVVAVLDLDDVE